MREADIVLILLQTREISLVVEQGTPNALAGVRFLYLPQMLTDNHMYATFSNRGSVPARVRCQYSGE
jgi:hypothetical protein